MNDLGELRRENRTLRHHFSRLSSTVLRINSSLDLDTVLQEVVDSACALTGAAQGVITTVDAGGGLAAIETPGTPDPERSATGVRDAVQSRLHCGVETTGRVNRPKAWRRTGSPSE